MGGLSRGFMFGVFFLRGLCPRTDLNRAKNTKFIFILNTTYDTATTVRVRFSCGSIFSVPSCQLTMTEL